MNDILKKLTSRKFVAAVAGTVLGAAITYAGLDVNITLSWMGAAMSGLSLLTYIITEGKIDAAAVKQTVGAVQQAIQATADSPSSGSILDGEADGQANVKMITGHLDKAQLSEMSMTDLEYLATEMGLDIAGKTRAEVIDMIAAEEVQAPAQ